MLRFFLGNLSYNFDETALIAALKEAGADASGVKIIRDRETGGSRGFGFVEVPDEQEPLMLALSGAQFGGRALDIQPAKGKPKPSGGPPRGRDESWGNEDRGHERKRGRPGGKR